MVMVAVEPPERLNKRTVLFFTDAQHQRWSAAAERLGVSLGHYVRECVEIAEKASTVHRGQAGER